MSDSSMSDSDEPRARSPAPAGTISGPDDLLVTLSSTVPLATVRYEAAGHHVTFMVRLVDHRNNLVWATHRRYSEFAQLHADIGQHFSATKDLLPPKHFLSRSNRSTVNVEKRRVGLERYVAALLDTLLHTTTAAQQSLYQPFIVVLLRFVEYPRFTDGYNAQWMVAARSTGSTLNATRTGSGLGLVRQDSTYSNRSESPSRPGSPSGSLPRQDSGFSAGSDIAGLTGSFGGHDGAADAQPIEETLWEPSMDLQGNHLALALPYVEVRMTVDGRWLVVVRNKRDAQRWEIRQRYDEAMQLTSSIKSGTTIPNVRELQTLVVDFRKRNPIRRYREQEEGMRARLSAALLDRASSTYDCSSPDEAHEMNRSFSGVLTEETLAQLGMASPLPLQDGAVTDDETDPLALDAAANVNDAPSKRTANSAHFSMGTPQRPAPPLSTLSSETRSILSRRGSSYQISECGSVPSPTRHDETHSACGSLGVVAVPLLAPMELRGAGDASGSLGAVGSLGQQGLRSVGQASLGQASGSLQRGGMTSGLSSATGSFAGPMAFDGTGRHNPDLTLKRSPALCSPLPVAVPPPPPCWRGCSCTDATLCSTRGDGDLYECASGHWIAVHPPTNPKLQ